MGCEKLLLLFEGGLDLVSDAFSLVVCTFEPIWIQSSSAGVCVNVVEIVRHVCGCVVWAGVVLVSHQGL